MILNADVWRDTPQIVSANAEFDNIVGVPNNLDKDNVFTAGGGFVEITDCPTGISPPATAQTSSISAASAAINFNCLDNPVNMDAIPLCFSHPMVQSSITHNSFLIHLNDGTIHTPTCWSTMPTYEYNERHCVVLMGYWMNRLPTDDPNHKDMKYIEIQNDLMLVTQTGLFNANGLQFHSQNEFSSYDEAEPYILHAKLNPVTEEGEGMGPELMSNFAQNFPNSPLSLYPTATHRVRMYNSGGNTPTGVGALNPNSFSKYYKLMASDGTVIEDTNVEYEVHGGLWSSSSAPTKVTVLGLADLGKASSDPDDICYVEDRDGYIDIVLKIDGDASVVVGVDAFFGDGLYNPGGPGQFTATDDNKYTHRTQHQFKVIDQDLDNANLVSWCGDANGNEIARTYSECMAAFNAGQVGSSQWGSFQNFMDRSTASQTMVGMADAQCTTSGDPQTAIGAQLAAGGTTCADLVNGFTCIRPLNYVNVAFDSSMRIADLCPCICQQMEPFKVYTVECGTMRNFADSKAYCESQGKEMASFHSDADVDQVKAQGVSCVAYMGAESDGQGNWSWLDGSNWWMSGSNDGMLGTLETKGAFDGVTDIVFHDWTNGEGELGVICQKHYPSEDAIKGLADMAEASVGTNSDEIKLIQNVAEGVFEKEYGNSGIQFVLVGLMGSILGYCAHGLITKSQTPEEYMGLL